MKPCANIARSSVCAVVLALLVGVGLASAETIRIGGSDFLAARVVPALIEAASHAGFELKGEFSGSLPALEHVENGKLDVALVLDAGGTATPMVPEGVETITVANFAVTVVVNPAHPLRAISLEQLTAVCGAGISQVLRTWGDLGLEGVWEDRAIVVMIVAGPHGLVRSLFRHAALGNRELAGIVAPVESVTEIVDEIRRGRNVMAVLSYAETPPGVRALAVQVEAGQGGVAPNEETIADGSYPLVLPLRLAFTPSHRNQAQAVARLLCAVSVSEALRTDGFVPSGARE